MKVKDIMTKDVITVKENDTVELVAKKLSECNLSGLPVVDEDNKIIGIVTEGDLLRRVSKIDGPSYIEILGGIFPLERKKHYLDKLNKYIGYLVKDIMTKEVITVSVDAAYEEVATLMVREKIKRIPVVDDEKKVIGIVSRKDIMKHIFQPN